MPIWSPAHQIAIRYRRNPAIHNFVEPASPAWLWAHRWGMPTPPDKDRALLAVINRQAGLVCQRQLLALAIDRTVVRAHVRLRRWQRVHPGVYSTFTGPLPELARVWAALLYAGEDAVACLGAAQWLCGLRPDLPAVVDVCVPHGRRHQPSRPGVRVRQSRRLSVARHAVKAPPQTTLENTVLDLIDEASTERFVIDLVLRACQQRLTTAARLAACARSRSRLRWRPLLLDLLAEVEDGVASPLERCYVRDVERVHGLPRGTRNRREGRRGRRRYRDVRYRRWRLVVELDGRAAHPEDERELDDLRDNEVAERGERTLRYGWRSVTGARCRVAVQVARLLYQGGWRGTPRPCGPGCVVAGMSVMDADRVAR